MALTDAREAVRAASAAGLYYPRDAAGLRSAVQLLLGPEPAVTPRLPKALVVPHAGYAYSGAVAAAGFRRLVHADAAGIRHVVVLGPSHRVKMRGLALPSCEYFETPLGQVRVDSPARLRLRGLGLAGVADDAHALEHSIEVQLPFLQCVLGEFDLLPIAVGMAPSEQVARALEAAWGGADTLIVVSTDLSHHHTHAEAQALDQQTAQRILERRSDLSESQACGADGLNGLLEVARHRGLQVELLDRRTSGDTAGDEQRVVGYGSFALYEPI